MVAVAGRYRVAGLIKRGGYAEVLEAFALGEMGFERRVAIKRLLPDAEREEDAIRAFLDEARLASQLHHANIVPVLDFGLLDGVPFQVLELVDGLDLGVLSERAQERRLPIPETVALHVATEVAHALAYAHEARDAEGRSLRIVHRDISPENVLVSWSGDVRLADFGIAWAAQRLAAATRVGVAKGKARYMAPEQWEGGEVDARTDVFGLGCLLHWLLTGNSPLEDDAVQRAMRAGEALPIDARISAGLRGMITTATAIDPARRYAGAEQMALECARELRALSDAPPRAVLERYLRALEVRPNAPAPAWAVGLFELELVLPENGSAPRRFATRIDAPAAPSFEEEGSTERSSESGPRDRDLTRVPRLEPGTVIDRFQIIGLIGSGSHAAVYRATHLGLGRACALKVLHSRAPAHARPVRRLQREAQALAQIRHPNVVEVFDFGVTEDGIAFLAMELFEGTNLKDLLDREGAMPPERARRIIRQIALGLGAAHDKGLVHRDLKLGNVMLIGAGPLEQAKVLDFGLVRDLSARSDQTVLTIAELMGTPNYLSPEQIRGASSVGPPADMYALGVILYALLSSGPPFTGAIASIVAQHLGSRPAPLPPAGGLEKVAAELLEKDPALRPTAKELIARLDGGEPDTTPLAPRKAPPPAAPEPPMPTPRGAEIVVERSLAAPIAVAGALLVAASLIALWVSSREAEPTRLPAAQEAPIAIPAAPPPAAEPSAADPSAIDPSAIDPSAIDPSTAEPSAAEPSAADPSAPRGVGRSRHKPPPRPLAAIQPDPVGVAPIDAPGIDFARVKARLDQAKQRFVEIARAHPELDRATLDRRYLDLRSALDPSLSIADLTALARKIDLFESELRRAEAP